MMRSTSQPSNVGGISGVEPAQTTGSRQSRQTKNRYTSFKSGETKRGLKVSASGKCLLFARVNIDSVEMVLSSENAPLLIAKDN